MKVNVIQKFGRFDDYWHPRIAAELNETHVKLVKVKGEFVWHRHQGEDELFWVVRGRLKILLRDGEVSLEPGEFAVIPKGVEHCPIADEESWVILIEPKTTLNTGNVIDHRTLRQLEWV